MKICSKCGVEKELTEFRKRKDAKDGFRSECLECGKLRGKQYYENNKETCLERVKRYRENNKETIKQYFQKPEVKERRLQREHEWHRQPKNKETIRRRNKQNYENNKEACLERGKQYRTRPEIRKQINSKQKQRRQNRPAERIHCIVSNRIREALKSQGGVKNAPTFSKLPYTPQQLVEHIESLWEPWMSWDNYGAASVEKKTWQIDHIVPHSVLLYDSMDHSNFLKCWAFENLRPLEAIENIRKGDKT